MTELGVDLRSTPHVLGVPRYMFGTALRDVVGMLRESLRGRPAAAFRHQMMVAYFAGYFWSRWQRARRRGLRAAHRSRDERVPPRRHQRTSKVVTTGR